MQEKLLARLAAKDRVVQILDRNLTKVALLKLILNEQAVEFGPMSRKGLLADLILKKASWNALKVRPIIMWALDIAPVDNPHWGALINHMADLFSLKTEGRVELPDMKTIEKY